MVQIGCGGIIIKENKVLLIRRINAKTFNEMWANPGGKIEDGESVENACIRELHEELGIKIRIIRKISEYHDYKNNELFGKYTGFLVTIESGEPMIKEPNKIAELKYWSLNDLPNNIAPYTTQYLKDLHK